MVHGLHLLQKISIIYKMAFSDLDSSHKYGHIEKGVSIHKELDCNYFKQAI